AEPAPGLAAEPAAVKAAAESASNVQVSNARDTDRYGIVVLSPPRWGFVWRRPQQFLSRFAKKHPILFVEEPFFDKPEGAQPDLQSHRGMPNGTVMWPHISVSWAKNPKLPQQLREWTKQAIENLNEDGAFD